MSVQPLGDPRDHYWTIIKMADAVGVPLVDAWDDGRLNAQDFSDMITACRGCSRAGACERLLEPHPTLEHAPDYCANTTAWDALRKA